MRRFFCDCCGMEITAKERQYGIVFYDRTECTQKIELHLCEKDVKKVRQMRFAPMKNVRVRTIPKFYNIIETHMGRQVSLYQIPEWNLDQIRSVNHKDPKRLFTVDGKRYYTPEFILSRVDGSIEPEFADKQLMGYVFLLYCKQTGDERKDYTTKWHNNRGFNKPDAKFMSAMAKVYFDNSEKEHPLTEKQLEEVRRRFPKYAEQVADILNDEDVIIPGLETINLSKACALSNRS